MIPQAYKRVVDNKMRDYGTIDLKKKIIKINKKAHKISHKNDTLSKTYSELIDTIVHEENHRKYPKMSEKKIVKKTAHEVETMGPKQKAKYYKLYNK